MFLKVKKIGVFKKANAFVVILKHVRLNVFLAGNKMEGK
jgi:hypothetical protein